MVKSKRKWLALLCAIFVVALSLLMITAITKPTQNSSGGFAPEIKNLSETTLPEFDVAITGDLVIGKTVTATLSQTLNEGNFEYQWYANTDTITDATNKSLTITKNLLGKKLYVTVSGKQGSPYDGAFEMSALTTNISAITVSYNPNSGEGTVPVDNTATYASGETVTVLFNPAPTKTGYVFKGWAISSISNIADYTLSGTKIFAIGDSNVTLYAVWELATYNFEITQTSGNWNALTAKYTATNTVTYTIRNTGTGLISDIKATLETGESFTVSDLSKTSLLPNETLTFTASFKSGKGFKAVPYTDTLNITAKQGSTAIALTKPIYLSQTVNKKAPTITTHPKASDIMYGKYLSDSALIGGATDVPGTWTWKDSSKTRLPEIGPYSREAVFAPNDTDYSEVTISITVNVTKSVLVLKTAPTVNALTYGQSLSLLTFSNGKVASAGDENVTVQGVWQWVNGAITPVTGAHSFYAKFTPTDTDRYKTAFVNESNTQITINVTVNKKTISAITSPNGADIFIGQTLKDSTLYDGQAGGTWAWKTDTVKPTSIGKFSSELVFTPNDTDNYDYTAKLNPSIEINVKKLDQNNSLYTALLGANITYGQKLLSSSITGGTVTNRFDDSEIVGTWAWKTPNLVQNSGSEQTFTVIFTPTDTQKYSTIESTLTINIIKAKPTVSGTAATLSYEQLLSDSLLNYTASNPNNADLKVNGFIQWKDAAQKPTVANSGYLAVFTPSDATNYEAVTITVNITVEKKVIASLTLPTASEIFLGQTLLSSKLTGGQTGGTWAWSSTADEPLTVGTFNGEAVFTPNDTANYNYTVSLNQFISVSVKKPSAVDLQFSPLSGTNITYGQKLSSSSITGGIVINTYNNGAVSGTWAWEKANDIENAGASQTFKVIFTPNNMSNFPKLETTLEIAIAKAKPNLSAPFASQITYGQKLSVSNISSGSATNPYSNAGVGGEFAWKDATIAPIVNNNGYEVIFTPTDTTNYIQASITISITVAKADYDMNSVVWNYSDPIKADGTEKTVTLTGLPVGVTAIYENNKAMAVGIYTATVTFTYDGDNYNTIPPFSDLSWEIIINTLDLEDFEWNYLNPITADGAEKSVTLKNLPNGITATYTGNKATRAGTYTASATLDYDPEIYAVINSVSDLSWEIIRGTLDVSGVSWNYSGTAFVADGTEKRVTLIGLPVGVTVDYTNNNKSAAGLYTATAVYVYDTDIYNTLPEIADCNWIINNAELEDNNDNGEAIGNITTAGGFSPDITFTIDTVNNSELLNISTTQIAGNNTKIKYVFDINLLKNGVSIQPDNTLKIKLLVDNSIINDNVLKVVRIEQDGTLTDMNAVLEGNYLVFSTEHLSNYAIIGDMPVQSSCVVHWLLMVLLILFVAFIALFFYWSVIKNSELIQYIGWATYVLALFIFTFFVWNCVADIVLWAIGLVLAIGTFALWWYLFRNPNKATDNSEPGQADIEESVTEQSEPISEEQSAQGETPKADEEQK